MKPNFLPFKVSKKKRIDSFELSESELQSLIIRRLAMSKLRCHWRQQVGGVPARIDQFGKPIFRRNPMKGFPDLAGLVQVGDLAVMWAMEIKTKKGVLSKEQKDWLRDLAEVGAIVKVVRSFDEADSFIRSLEEIQVKYKNEQLNIFTRETSHGMDPHSHSSDRRNSIDHQNNQDDHRPDQPTKRR